MALAFNNAQEEHRRLKSGCMRWGFFISNYAKQIGTSQDSINSADQSSKGCPSGLYDGCRKNGFG
jgi:hypothetical protein